MMINPLKTVTILCNQCRINKDFTEKTLEKRWNLWEKSWELINIKGSWIKYFDKSPTVFRISWRLMISLRYFDINVFIINSIKGQ